MSYNVLILIQCTKNKNVPMSIQKTLRIKKIESDFILVFVGQRFKHTTSRYKHADYPERSDFRVQFPAP
jgi:hypothetical protein